MLDTRNLLSSIDTSSLISKMLGSMATKNFAAGLLTGGVATTLLGGGKDTIETITKVGGIALLGTLAYKAYGNYQQQKASGANPSVFDAVKTSAAGLSAQANGIITSLFEGQQQQSSVPNAFLPSSNPELPIAIIRSMIAAAKADGHMDRAESEKIIGQLESVGLNTQEKNLLIQEMANTPDIKDIAVTSKTPEESVQIYLAALLVCDSQCANEQNYLATLATALKLEPAFTSSLQQELLKLSESKAA